MLGSHDEARAAWQQAVAMYQKQGRADDAARVQQRFEESCSPTPGHSGETAGLPLS
jgi:hypothetical protein